MAVESRVDCPMRERMEEGVHPDMSVTRRLYNLGEREIQGATKRRQCGMKTERSEFRSNSATKHLMICTVMHRLPDLVRGFYVIHTCSLFHLFIPTTWSSSCHAFPALLGKEANISWSCHRKLFT